MSLFKEIKIIRKRLLRFKTDLLNGHLFLFAKKRHSGIEFSHFLEIRQQIMPSETFDNKVHNLKLVAEKINPYVVLPNEIFSFWKLIGRPNKRFKTGRSLVNGKLQEEYGGGLCQASGIIYHLSILAGLEILERYNHSVDIYTEKTRFTPLGTDATVAFGYKDLRIKNSFDFPIKFELKIDEDQFVARVYSTQPIPRRRLVFDKEEDFGFTKIRVTYEGGSGVNYSEYKKL